MERARVRDCTHAPFVRVRRVARSHPPLILIRQKRVPWSTLSCLLCLKRVPAPLAYCSDLQVHAFSFSCQSVYKLSPTSLSAFDRTDITAPCTTPRRHQGQNGEVGRISPTCRLWRRDDEDDGREENIAAAMNNSEKVRWLSACPVSFCLPHAGYGGGTTTRRMVATTTGREAT